MGNNKDSLGIDTSDWIVELPEGHPALTPRPLRKFREDVANAEVLGTYPRPGRIPDDLELMYPLQVGRITLSPPTVGDTRELYWDISEPEPVRRRFNNLSRAMKNQFMRNIRFYGRFGRNDKKSRK